MTPITAKNLLRHELIGLETEVVRDENCCNLSIYGKIIDETKNTIIIQQGENSKRIVKRTATLRFKLPDGVSVDVEGSSIVGRPEDRVKRKMKRGW